MEQLSTNHSLAEGLAPRDSAMLEYVTQLVKEPWAMSPEQVDGLRNAGFTDRAILETNLVASYMSFVNRLAQGLGVELEDFFDDFTR